MVVEHHLRLDRCLVTDRDNAIRFAGAQRLHRLDHREEPADAVIGDAGVGALQAVLDADVPEHVVGQRAQEPHRVDRVGQLAAELAEVAVGGGQERKVVVLVLEIAAARADDHAAAVAVAGGLRFAQSVAMDHDARFVDGAPRGVQADEVGAPDELVQLAVVDHRARIEIRNLPGDVHRPAGGVPSLDRAHRGGAGTDRRENVRRLRAGGADGAGSGDDDFHVGRARGGLIRGPDAASRCSCCCRRSRRSSTAPCARGRDTALR